MSHTWTEYPDGTAHCKVCGSFRFSDGAIKYGRTVNLYCPPPCKTTDLQLVRRVTDDGVIIEEWI